MIINISKGVGGIVYEPYKGGRKNGVKGVTIGFGKGLAGLIGKPLKGGFYLVAQPMMGLKNTPSYIKKKTQSKKRTSFHGTELQESWLRQ